MTGWVKACRGSITCPPVCKVYDSDGTQHALSHTTRLVKNAATGSPDRLDAAAGTKSRPSELTIASPERDDVAAVLDHRLRARQLDDRAGPVQPPHRADHRLAGDRRVVRPPLLPLPGGEVVAVRVRHVVIWVEAVIDAESFRLRRDLVIR